MVQSYPVMRKKLTHTLRVISLVCLFGLGSLRPAFVATGTPKPQAWGIASSPACENTSSAIFSTVFHKTCDTAIVEGIAVVNLPNKSVPEVHPPSPTPELSPMSTGIVIKSAGSSAQFSQSNGSLNADVIFSMINTDRNQAGLPSFKQDPNLCELASQRATEIISELWNGTLHSGLYNRNLSYWVTENAIFMPTEESAVNWWLHSPIHREAIYSTHIYSCVKCTGDSCSELFTDFQLK